MAVFKCADCQGTVSDKAPACPHCGAPVTKPEAIAPAEPKAAKKPMSKGVKITIGVVSVLMVVSCISAGIDAPKTEGQASQAVNEPAAPKPMSKIEALTACQMLIKKAANDPEKADIP